MSVKTAHRRHHELGKRNLDDAVALLPTPRATDGEKGGPNQRGSSGDLMLSSAAMLLPTPTVADSRGSRNATAGRSDPKGSTNHNGWTLTDVFWADVPMLPTPTAKCAEGSQTHRSGKRSNELLLDGVAKALSTGPSMGQPSSAGLPSSEGLLPPRLF
jgi:hypothetical protein